MIKVIVTGSKGRMGSRIASLVKNSRDMSILAEIDREDSIEKFLQQGNVIIDFTTAEAAARHATLAAEHKIPIVIGTTGLSDGQKQTVQDAAKKTAVLLSPNMSVGVNLMWKLIEVAGKTLSKQYKVDIVETHHVRKLDKPSGTARKMLDIVLQESGRHMESDVFFYEDESNNPPENRDPEISIRSIRRGEVVGDHAIHFTSPGETLSILHHAATRDIFAEGAITAARWIVGRPAGLYGMDDVLGFQK